jgi:hypothetical protein
MTIAAPVRAKQTTTTTGTGTLTLIAPTSGRFRSFLAALGGAAVTLYALDYGTGYEIGIGTYDGGTPGTLTRATVLASSNGGSLVSLPAGTTDVFLPGLPGLWGIRTGTGADTLGVDVAGERYVWTGSSNATLTLPPVGSFPSNQELPILNAGTAILTVDGNAAETILGRGAFLLYPGQDASVIRRGGAWDARNLREGLPIRKSGISATVSGTKVVTFPVAFPNAIDASTFAITIAGGTGTADVVPLRLGASSTTGFTVWGSASESVDFVWRVDGY